MWTKVSLPVAGLRNLTCKVVRMVGEKYNELSIRPFGRASIRGDPFGDHKTVNIIFVEVTVFFTLTCPVTLRSSYILS
jgi:hypothetical protein